MNFCPEWVTEQLCGSCCGAAEGQRCCLCIGLVACAEMCDCSTPSKKSCMDSVCPTKQVLLIFLLLDILESWFKCFVISYLVVMAIAYYTQWHTKALDQVYCTWIVSDLLADASAEHQLTVSWNYYLLGVEMNVPDEHPSPFHMDHVTIYFGCQKPSTGHWLTVGWWSLGSHSQQSISSRSLGWLRVRCKRLVTDSHHLLNTFPPETVFHLC